MYLSCMYIWSTKQFFSSTHANFLWKILWKYFLPRNLESNSIFAHTITMTFSVPLNLFLDTLHLSRRGPSKPNTSWCTNRHPSSSRSSPTWSAWQPSMMEATSWPWNCLKSSPRMFWRLLQPSVRWIVANWRLNCRLYCYYYITVFVSFRWFYWSFLVGWLITLTHQAVFPAG